MKIKKLIFIILIFCVEAISIAQPQLKKRENKIFNSNWKFTLTDSSNYSDIDFDNTGWRLLDLPHDWSIEAEFKEAYGGRNAWLPGGIAWYRKEFYVDKKDEGENFEIQFDGIYRHSKIWVNGVFIGGQYDGYTSFYFDITEALKFGESNTIAIRVDNSVQPNCRWYSGSGIYRNVRLIKTNPLHVKNWGTYITTPSVSKTEATVSIQTTIENDGREKEFTLKTIVYDDSGIEVANIETEHIAGPLRSIDITQNIIIPNPALWSSDSPLLYTVTSEIKNGGEIMDDYLSTFGIRTIEFDADKGFFLNGENMKIKGVCLHHGAGAFGSVVPIQVWERRLNKLKSLGCNAIRTAHNPPAPEFLDLCDQLGFLVMDEFVDKWDNISMENAFYDTPYADPYFHTEWQQNFAESIRRDRNHPCIFIWSVGNENHPSGDERQNTGLKRYCNFVRTIEPTRPVISGMERGKDLPVDQKVDNIIKSCSFMDLIALNYGEQWCNDIYDKKPGKPYISTESYTYFNSSKDYRWADIERSPWLDVMENDFNMGLFLWVGICYLGESSSWPRLGSVSGLYDIAGFRTSRSYLYEAFWSEKPVIHINVYEGDADDFSTSGRWGWPPMNVSWNLEKGKKYDMVTYTNCEEVDLYLNNKKIGTQKLEDFPNWIMKWREIGYKPGTLRAVGKIDGKVVCEDVLKTTGTPKKLILDVDPNNKFADDIVQVEVTLTDKKGNPVTHDDRRIQFKLEGDGQIEVLTNGNMTTEEYLQQRVSKATYKGKLLCVIKKTAKQGSLKLIAYGEGIDSNVLVVEYK